MILHRITPLPRDLRRAASVVAIALVAVVTTSVMTDCAGSGGSGRLVEVFDNGPVVRDADGKFTMIRGPSEGYVWVGASESPPTGKSWREVNPDDLSPEDRARIRR